MLARPYDYALLTLVVLASYVQAVFGAFPLVQLQGPGSHELGDVLMQISFNATRILGRLSAFDAVQRFDRSLGLSVIESLEDIERRNPASDSRMLVQQLASATYKNSSRAQWTHPKTSWVEWLDFYGVKIISRIESSAETLQQHALTIHTRGAPR